MGRTLGALAVVCVGMLGAGAGVARADEPAGEGRAGAAASDAASERPSSEEAAPSVPAEKPATRSVETMADPGPWYARRARTEKEEHLPYKPGRKVPEGYVVEEVPRYGLVAGGAALAGGLHLVSMIAAMALDAEADQTFTDDQGGTRSDPEFASRYTAMFIPFVGPFITIRTADAKGTGMAILTMDGAAQLAGAALFTAGWLAPRKQLTREDVAITVAPLFASGGGGVQVVGSF